MNYFELYPGDYLRDTTRLSLLEHGAYLRLLLAYYGEGVPFPDDLGELYVAAGAGSAGEKAAVRKVADKYFPVAVDGLRRNKRADEVIALADERMEGSDERKANDAERKRRSRARRSAMFDALREVGQVPDFDATMDDLKTLVARHVTPDRCVTLGVTPSQKSHPVTRDGTATRPQTPYTNQDQELSPPATFPPDPPARHPTPTEAGRACLLMRQAGCGQVNPGHVDLLAALAEGVTPEVLGYTAAEAIAAGKRQPFTWAITTARGRHADGPAPMAAAARDGPSRPGPRSKTMQALQNLEGMKNGTGLDNSRDQLRLSTADPAEP